MPIVVVFLKEISSAEIQDEFQPAVIGTGIPCTGDCTTGFCGYYRSACCKLKLIPGVMIVFIDTVVVIISNPPFVLPGCLIQV